MKKALDEISGLGYIPIQVNETKLQFEFNGKVINYFPYSGWASGATIKDGRGLKNLLRQIC